MDRARVNSLTTHVPTIKRAVNLQALPTFQGGKTRFMFALLCMSPLMLAVDLNGGVLTAGFTRGPVTEKNYKMRADFATG